MKKYIIFLLILFSFIFSFAQNQIYSTYLDSLENAYEIKDTLSLERFSRILTAADSSRYEGFYYLAYAKYISGRIDSAAFLSAKSVSIEKKPNNCYLHSLILKRTDNKAFPAVTGEYINAFPSDYRFANLKASYFLDKDNIDSAAVYANRVLKYAPNDENALYIMSLYFYRKDKYPEAMRNAEQLVKLNPRDPYRLILGNIYRKSGDLVRSNSIYSSLINSKYDFYARKYLSENYFKASFYDSCFACLRESAELYPESTQFYVNMLALYDKYPEQSLLEFFANKAESGAIKNGEILEAAGTQLFKDDKYDLSAYFFSRLLNSNPSYTSKEAVQSFIFSGNYEQAERVLDNMAALQSYDSLFLYNYAGINDFKMNEYLSAQENFEKAYSISKEDTNLIYNLFNMYYLNREDGKILMIIDSIKTEFPGFSQRMMSKFFPEQSDSVKTE